LTNSIPYFIPSHMNTTLEIAKGNRIARIAENNYAGKTTYIVCCFIGDVTVRSKSFKSIKGAEKAARNWLVL
jgi:hypothetical protein